MLQTPHSYQIESRLISGLLKFGDKIWPQIESFIDKDIFYDQHNRINSTVFSVIKSYLDNGHSLDIVLIAEKISSLGIQFDDITPLGYLEGLNGIQISEEGVIEVCKEAVTIKVRRNLFNALKKQATLVAKDTEKTVDELISSCDEVYSDIVKTYSEGKNEPVNLFDNIEVVIEDYAKEIKQQPGLISPWPVFDRDYGGFGICQSYCFAARSSVGKSTMLDDLAFSMGNLINQNSIIGQEHIPVIKVDTEMKREEILLRLTSRMSGVSPYYIQTGQFSKNKELYDKVTKAGKQLKNYKYYHLFCPQLEIKEVINIVKRFIYKYVGRDNPYILNWDYIKIGSEKLDSSNNSYVTLGRKLDLMHKLIKEDTKGCLLFAVQRNRTGIDARGKPADKTEGSFGDSDMIFRLTSFAAILARREIDELVKYPLDRFGSHYLSVVKSGRMQGIGGRGHNDFIKLDGKYEPYFINFNIDNFKCTEMSGAEENVKWLELQGNSIPIRKDNTILN